MTPAIGILIFIVPSLVLLAIVAYALARVSAQSDRDARRAHQDYLLGNVGRKDIP